MKKFISISLYSLLAITILIIGTSIFMFNFSLKSKVTATDEEDAYAYLAQHEYLRLWIDSLKQSSALCDTTITASDGAQLHGFYLHAAKPTNNTALIIHGYTDNALRMMMIGHLYNKELEYNIILPDLRAHGKSDGKYIQMGWKDRLDMLEWIDVSKKIYGDSINMVLHGISMGAATAMMLSGEDLPTNVKCVVADCGYTSVWDEFEYNLKEDFGLPAFPLMYTTSYLCKTYEGWSFKEASALKQVEKSTLPILFIHGDADTYVPTEMAHHLFKAKQKGEKELWIVPGVKHAQAYWDYTEEYVERTRNFVNKYL